MLFPTKEVTGLNFILHAPFLLTDSREGIRAGVAHNDRMIQRVAVLAADALEYLRDIGKETSTHLIEDSIVTIIPVDPEKFSKPSDKRKVSFLPFYQAIREKFKKQIYYLRQMDTYLQGCLLGCRNSVTAIVFQCPIGRYYWQRKCTLGFHDVGA